jgi:KipI family sensor histidine kinase inhibitor
MARANAEEAYGPIQIVPAGDSAIIVRLGIDISPATHARVMELLRLLDLSAPLPGVLDLVPAYASVMVAFDPLLTHYDDLEGRLRTLLQTMRPVARLSRRGRLVRIPVQYGGLAGPDLAEVAQLLGLRPEEVVHKHSSALYRVYFLGFQTGFPYLGGLPPELAVPRLSRPRPEVPAGSVGIAGRQTGIYPVATPGGWRLIGRTRRQLFDARRNPPALLRPGDRVKFEVISNGKIGAATDTSASRTVPSPAVKMPAGSSGIPWLAVVRPGPQASVQDLGRHGYARYGVCVSGAADTDALLLGNALLQNPPGAAALELTLGGSEFEVLAPCEVAVTGADCEVVSGGRTLAPHTSWHLVAGDLLQVGSTLRGTRVYLCVQGGVQVESVLGSCSTDIRAGIGGIDGRALRSGDILQRGTGFAPIDIARGLPSWLEDPHYLPHDRSWVIRILPGPESSRPELFQPSSGGSECVLLPGTYTVDPISDRVGVRLHPPRLPSAPLPYPHEEMAEKISEGVPLGAIQLLPSGEAIILLADHQTTGGYPVRAVVASVDMWRVAQLRPGDRVRFRLISLEAAVHLLRQSRERLVRSVDASSGVYAATTRLQPGVEELLMRGFLEWSDDDDSYDL